jgi:dihydropyrimidinase
LPAHKIGAESPVFCGEAAKNAPKKTTYSLKPRFELSDRKPYDEVMKSLLIRNGLVVTEDAEEVCDVLCEGEIITRIGKNLGFPGAEELAEIDAGGKVVIPGGVDAHTHLCLDAGIAVASDDFYTGTVAAACGGTTSIIDHPSYAPAGAPPDYIIRKYHGLAEGEAVVDYGFHGVIQHVDDGALECMDALAGEGITSYKLYMTYQYKLADGAIYRVLEKAKESGLLIAVHAENDGVIGYLREKFRSRGRTSPAWHPLSRPAECEAEAVNRMILMAKMAGDAPLYIVHLSSALGLEFITAARRRGQKNLYAETCPQYLLLDGGLYSLPGIEGLKYLMCPPLRAGKDREALWRGLEGDIDTVATDHCPFFFETQKILGKDDFTRCPSGAPGIEERIPLMYSEGVAKKRLSLRRFTRLCATNPAKLFGLYPKKGVIKEGSDADLVIIDPRRRGVLGKKTLHANVDYSAYEGFELEGAPVCTVSRGEVIVRDGVFLGARGRGRFLKREKGMGL